ncbi:butyrophilin subfamily 3 member A2-like isoform X3 [Corvus moneduloides]|uniref:butyrophilin subfamily 3 member A2-like isoform X3 n=1 Tax=Corvus moneduloides TaxID=1196302 RepID=UPI001363947B|nr:butyrophilin subfamily 3 member A2-like isoform X3 [Corvus moneduloides]
MGSRFRPAVTLPILVFLQIIPGVTGQYSIIPPDSPVLGVVGDGAVLPCQLQGRIIPEKLSIQWIFSGSSTESEVAIFYGKNHQNPFLEFKGYQSRTEFFPSEFHRGNLSLLLKNVRPSDKGEYTCSVFLENWYDQVMVELDVAAQGAEPSVFLDGHAGNGISLSCRSQGWFPAPSVVWLDSQGQTRPEEVTTRSTTGPSSGIFDVVSSMSLELGSDREVSCRVVNEVLNATRESRVRIADSFFPSTSPWMIASLIILSVDLGILGATVYKMKQRSRKEAGTEKDRLKAQLAPGVAGFSMDWGCLTWKTPSEEVPITGISLLSRATPSRAGFLGSPEPRGSRGAGSRGAAPGSVGSALSIPGLGAGGEGRAGSREVLLGSGAGPGAGLGAGSAAGRTEPCRAAFPGFPAFPALLGSVRIPGTAFLQRQRQPPAQGAEPGSLRARGVPGLGGRAAGIL